MAQSKCSCYAICTDPKRQEMWNRVFPPEGHVPIKPPFITGTARVKDEEFEFYKVDLDRVTPEQRENILIEMTFKFGLPGVEVRKDLTEKGLIVKADDVITTWCPLHVRAVM